jgi:hypothetical protein
MSAAVAFDTLKFVEKLEAAGVPHAQAKATAEAFAEATSQELATKADLALLRADLDLVRSQLETKIDKVELRLEAKIEATKSEIVKWQFGTIGFQTLVILGAVLALAKFAHP